MPPLATTALLVAVAAGLGPVTVAPTVGPEQPGAPTTTPAPVEAAPTGHATPSPSIGATPPLAPERAIAVERGRLSVIEIPAGRSVGGLDAGLDATGVGEGANSLTYSRARHSVLFSRVVTAARQEIVEAPLDGRQAVVVATGHTVAPAPDGERFALGRRELGEQDPDREVLEVRTFDGQALRRWTDPVTSEEPLSISHLSWSPDGQQVAFELRFEDATETRILDMATDDGSLQGASQRVDPPGDRRMLSAPAFRPDDGTLVVVDGPALDPDARQHWRVAALAPDTGDVEDVLDATDRAITQLDFDHTGQHLLYLQGHAHPPRSQDPVGPPGFTYWHDGASNRRPA